MKPTATALSELVKAPIAQKRTQKNMVWNFFEPMIALTGSRCWGTGAFLLQKEAGEDLKERGGDDSGAGEEDLGHVAENARAEFHILLATGDLLLDRFGLGGVEFRLRHLNGGLQPFVIRGVSGLRRRELHL